MRFSVIAATAAIVAGVSATSNGTVHYTTEVVTAYTTYCPAATEITHGDVTYTVSEATTLTITNCPCTLTHPVYVSTVSSCSTCAPAGTGAPYTVSNATVTTSTAAGTGTPIAPTSAPTFTGAANQVVAGAGAGLAALFGIAAFVL